MSVQLSKCVLRGVKILCSISHASVRTIDLRYNYTQIKTLNTYTEKETMYILGTSQRRQRQRKLEGMEGNLKYMKG
jgi:hypothetical protein